MRLRSCTHHVKSPLARRSQAGIFFDYYVGSTMAEQGNQADEDENWLYARLDAKKIKPSGLQVDAFCDRVWELLSTKGLLINDARRIALEEIWGKR